MIATLRPAMSDRIGVLLVVHVGGISARLSDSGPGGCPLELGQRDAAGALQLHDAIGSQEIFEVVELGRRALEATVSWSPADGQDPAAEHLHQLDDLARGSGRRPTP